MCFKVFCLCILQTHSVMLRMTYSFNISLHMFVKQEQGNSNFLLWEHSFLGFCFTYYISSYSGTYLFVNSFCFIVHIVENIPDVVPWCFCVSVREPLMYGIYSELALQTLIHARFLFVFFLFACFCIIPASFITEVENLS